MLGEKKDLADDRWLTYRAQTGNKEEGWKIMGRRIEKKITA